MSELKQLFCKVYEVPLDEVAEQLDEVVDFFGAEYVVDHTVPVEFSKTMLHYDRGNAAAVALVLGHELSSDRIEVLASLVIAGKKALLDMLRMPIEEVAQIKKSHARGEAGFQLGLARARRAHELEASRNDDVN